MRIYIIEEHDEPRINLETFLEKHGYAVDATGDLSQAEKYMPLNHSEYDLMLIGYSSENRKQVRTLCRNLRRQAINIPIIALAGTLSAEDRIKALDAGIDECLSKPYSNEELLANIRAVMRRPREMIMPEITYADITLIPAEYVVVVNGRRIELKQKQFEILGYLMRHPNQVMTREQITDHVWDADFDSFSNIVDVHIHYIRKMLAENHSRAKLQTVYGVGYRLAM